MLGNLKGMYGNAGSFLCHFTSVYLILKNFRHKWHTSVFALHKSADAYMCCKFCTNFLSWVPENTHKGCVPQIAIRGTKQNRKKQPFPHHNIFTLYSWQFKKIISENKTPKKAPNNKPVPNQFRTHAISATKIIQTYSKQNQFNIDTFSVSFNIFGNEQNIWK